MIKEQIVSKGHGAVSPKFLVVHSTANPGATAQNHAKLWKRSDYAVHYVSDWKEALHTVADNRKCWHVGNANSKSIGIEICEAKTKADFKKGWDIAVKACAEILKKHKWDVSDMVTHDYCRRVYGGTTHTDPIPYFKKWGTSFDEFKKDVKEAMGAKPKPKPKPKPETKPAAKPAKGYKVKVTASLLNVRKGAGTKYAIVGKPIERNEVYTIVETKNGWGKLKSGAGWIALKYTKKL